MMDRPAKSPAEINVVDLATLAASMSRLLASISTMTPLKNASFSLAEWAALALLSEKDGISNKHLARMLGVTGQRASQIGAALIKAGRVTADQSTEDNRKKVIRISEVGKSDLVAVNSQIHRLLCKALKNNGHALIAANKSLRVFSRIVQVDTSEQSLAGGTTQVDHR